VINLDNKTDINEVCIKLRDFFFSDNDVLLVLLFGSFGTPEEHSLSDIDVAVLLRDRISLQDELRMSAELTQLLSREDIDLVLLRQTGVNIAYRALTTGRKVFTRDPLLITDFAEKIINDYLDFGLRLESMDRDFAEGLREDYLHGQS
jgi:predicted nucleotidyltransferase